MMDQRYDALDSGQSSRAAALEIAATHTAGVVKHLDRRSVHGKVNDAPKGGLRAAFGKILDGEVPKSASEFDQYTYSDFGDVTLRFAQWIELGFDTDKIEYDDEEES